jgi:hypothetical protein
MKYPLFLRAYNSPFKPLKLKWYFGKTAVGVPIFLPRKWVNDKDNPRYMKAIPLKVDFSFCDVMWKTKWSSTDFRHEYNSVWSFVFFGYQITVTFYSPYDSHYFEPFLFYYFATDKNKSRKERVNECRTKFPCTWTSYTDGKKETIDYYELILKTKYLK